MQNQFTSQMALQDRTYAEVKVQSLNEAKKHEQIAQVSRGKHIKVSLSFTQGNKLLILG